MDELPFGALTECPLAVPAILLVLVLPAWETAFYNRLKDV